MADIQVDISKVGTFSGPNLADLGKLVVNPSALWALLTGPGTPQTPTNNGAQTKVHPKAGLFDKLHAFLGDAFGRLNTGMPLHLLTSTIYTIANAQQDYVIQRPPGSTTMTVRAALNGSPADDIQAYLSAGIIWGSFSPRGLAFDDGTGTYTGFPIQPDKEYAFDLHTSAGSIHVASPVAGTVIVLGWAG